MDCTVRAFFQSGSHYTVQLLYSRVLDGPKQAEAETTTNNQQQQQQQHREWVGIWGIPECGAMGIWGFGDLGISAWICGLWGWGFGDLGV